MVLLCRNVFFRSLIHTRDAVYRLMDGVPGVQTAERLKLENFVQRSRQRILMMWRLTLRDRLPLICVLRVLDFMDQPYTTMSLMYRFDRSFRRDINRRKGPIRIQRFFAT